MTSSVSTKLLLATTALLLLANPVTGHANEAGGHELIDVPFPFEGPMGTYDKAALQRGLQVYRQVCAGCHSLKRVAFRNLTELGYSEAQVKAIAAEYTVMDGPNDDGEMFERAARPSDHFKPPFANDKAAAAANNGAIPPDLSLITKARHGGADYVFNILTGYKPAPEGMALNDNQHYNIAKDGNILAMAPPLSDGAVTYEDGSPQTVEQYAKDVASFLTWTAEPEMEARKRMGMKVIIFLTIFAGLMYAVKRKIWSKVH